MHNFPKKYTQTKKSLLLSKTNKSYPFFFQPEQYTNTFTLEHIFRLFMIDAIHFLNYGTHLVDGNFIQNQSSLKDEKTPISFLKKQLKQFGFLDLVSGLQSIQSLSFSFLAQHLFAQNVRLGNIFENSMLVYWSPNNKTPISADMVNILPINKNQYTIRYFVSTKNHSLDILTDTPETIFGDVAIALHPQHKKAKQLKGQSIIIPITNKTIPIIIDERADFTKFGGVYRITPGHDKVGLEIAKDHQLPIDIYAIDEYGYFTEHAGLFAKKPVKDFFSNITQNLADIGNLTKTGSYIGETAYCKESNELLISRTWKGFFFKIPKDSIENFLNQKSIIDTGITNNTLNSSYRIASDQHFNGISIPIWTNENGVYVIDYQRLYDMYISTKTKGGLAFGLFILYCISNKKIPISFSTEEIIFVISKQLEYNNSELSDLFVEIGNIFPESKKEFKELLTLFQNLHEEKTLEKSVENLINNLDQSFCLQKNQENTYQFSPEIFDKNLGNIQLHQQVISNDFISSFLLIQKVKHTLSEPLIFTTSIESLKSAIKTIIFAQHNIGIPFIKKVYSINCFKKEKNSIKDILADIKITKEFHSDCIRISFLALSDPNTLYDGNLFGQWDQKIAKFWNACRYIKTTFFEEISGISLKKTQQKLEKEITSCSAFDSRILYKLATLREEYQQIEKPEHIGTFINHVFEFIQQDFSSKYLELIKSAQSEYSPHICVGIIGTLLSFLRPYLPIITENIWEFFGFEESLDNLDVFISTFTNIPKNYSISLFMEIIDKFSLIKYNLGIKKHDAVSVFLRSNPDFIVFFKSNESLLKKTLNAQNIVYLMHHEDIPDGYQKDDIIDISIGLKAFSKATLCGIIPLQKQLQKKEEYLQYLKHLVQQLNESCSDVVIIQQKRDEISIIKKEIEDLAFEISKCKMK